ncbi:uncharacterized protein si:dkey-9i23.16 isoform X2 [Scomber japonicus]|uniref:uncharacterized protein si:dkey-9i23.16 isoform X2 n=1 Tax=Scomber japonicus TaxID=13676 RepID=UPI002305CBB6|nr:uncharacterized protein si:dkey-9i23.16 isoform X2 [Scomber japonicus]
MSSEGAMPAAEPRLHRLSSWFDPETAAIVAGGSFTMANERNPSRLLLRGCACSNVIGLLVALLAFCLYCFSLSTDREELCVPVYSDFAFRACPGEILTAYCWSVTLLLLVYDTGAVVLHCLLSISALKALKTD